MVVCSHGGVGTEPRTSEEQPVFSSLPSHVLPCTFSFSLTLLCSDEGLERSGHFIKTVSKLTHIVPFVMSELLCCKIAAEHSGNVGMPLTLHKKDTCLLGSIWKPRVERTVCVYSPLVIEKNLGVFSHP